MKTKTFPTICIILLVTIFSSSCNKSNDDENNFPSPSILAKNNWLLGEYVYSRSNSVQVDGSYTNGKPFTIINMESNITSDNGAFLASNLQISFNTSTVGDYIIKSESTTVTEDQLKYLDIQCEIINEAGNSALYKSQDTNKLAKVSLVNGKLVVNIPEQIILVLSSNNGLSHPPESFLFMCNKVR